MVRNIAATSRLLWVSIASARSEYRCAASTSISQACAMNSVSERGATIVGPADREELFFVDTLATFRLAGGAFAPGLRVAVLRALAVTRFIARTPLRDRQVIPLVPRHA